MVGRIGFGTYGASNWIGTVASMRLDRTRKATEQAGRALVDLESTVDDSDRFRDEFVSCISMIQRVGSILDEESKGHRTAEFGQFWKATGDDPLFRFMADVRNAEFKRGEDRKSAQHEVGIFDTLTMTSSLNIKVIRGGEVVEERTNDDPPPDPPPTPESTHTIAWYFRGGAHDGEEVLGLVRRYVAWLRDTIIPQAEALTTD
jgi:hypothetical protein